MTRQTRTTIEAADVIAVQITCTHCGTSVSQNIDKWQNNLACCPNCNAGWMPHRQSLIYIGDIMTRLRHLAILPKENPAPGISIRFELTQDKEA